MSALLFPSPPFNLSHFGRTDQRIGDYPHFAIGEAGGNAQASSGLRGTRSTPADV